MPAKYSSKFQLKPEVWVFVPTLPSLKLGEEIKTLLEKRWKAPSYYFHLRKGGHVAALRSHFSHKYFLHLDIQNFFGSINKSRVTRNLKKFFPYLTARDFANHSTVVHPETKKTVLPFGFVQSPIIASLCLEQSALGSHLDKLHKTAEISVSVYVDDIVISADNEAAITAIKEQTIYAAEQSLFSLNEKKSEGPSLQITAFNIQLSNAMMNITPEKMREFKKTYGDSSSEDQRRGILGYISSVNYDQLSEVI